MPNLFSVAPVIKKDSVFHRHLQKRVANVLFPAGKGDWYQQKGYGNKKQANGLPYLSAFDAFVDIQKNDASAQYHRIFAGLDLSMAQVNSQLAQGESCHLEVLSCTPFELDAVIKPGSGKHVVYFPGANTYYQACFRDIATAAKETGATVHAFNFPGTGASTGQVKEANDLVNAGIAVVNDLLGQGVSPDDIILQGDCYGAAIASRVKQEFEYQSGLKLRLVMNNAFKSFKAVIYNMLDGLPNVFKTPLKALIKMLLKFTGWHVTPGKEYGQSGPYQCHIQHLGDQTLVTSSLSNKVKKYRSEMKTGITTSIKRAAKIDTCPEEYHAARDRLDNKHMVRIKEEAREHLSKKFGVNKHGEANAHFADLCELETLSGESVYTGFVNEYLMASNAYIDSHPQHFDLDTHRLPTFLTEAYFEEMSQDAAKELNGLTTCLEDQKNTNEAVDADTAAVCIKG